MLDFHSALKLLFLLAPAAVLPVAGCSALQARIGYPAKAAPPPEAASPGSLIDSLWSAPLAVDTVVLEPRAPGDSLPERYTGEFRRGPAALEVGRPAQRWGYRVQLASADNIDELDKLRLQVQREFGEPASLEQHGSRFTLRIGAFLRLEEAEAERARAISYGYRYAWIVQTLIALQELKPKE